MSVLTNARLRLSARKSGVDTNGQSLRGRLLVATPPLIDPNFDRTVVLMLEHTEEGALGIVLNRPSETPLDDVLPEWRAFASLPGVVFTGGPVAPDAVIALARGPRDYDPDDAPEGWVPILEGLGTIDLGRDPLDLGVLIEELRVFVGYAGWGPGQLEGELEQNAWFVVDLQRNDPFAALPDYLWRAVLRRQRGKVAMFANYPTDASDN
jgi:putative transcriptional regulator